MMDPMDQPPQTNPLPPLPPEPPQTQTPVAAPVIPPRTPEALSRFTKQNFAPKLPSRVWLIIALLLAVVLGILFFVFIWPARVRVAITPASASITLGEHSATEVLEKSVQPGEYDLVAELAGYVPLKRHLTLGLNSMTDLNITLRTMPQPVRLTNTAVQFLALDSDRQSVVYLEPGTNTAFRLLLDSVTTTLPTGQVTPTIDPITPPTLSALSDMNWSPNRQLAFLKLSGNVTKQYDFKRYDLVNQVVRDWPQGVGSIDWRPDGQKVAYVYEPTGGERSLIRATIDNTEQERLLNLDEAQLPSPTIAWSPDSTYLSLIANEHLHLFEVFPKTLQPIEGLSAVRQARWLPNSSGLIVWTADHALFHVTLDGTVTDLNLVAGLDQVAIMSESDALVLARGVGNAVEIQRLGLTDQTLTPYVFQTTEELFPANVLLTDVSTLFFTSAGRLYALRLDTGQYE